MFLLNANHADSAEVAYTSLGSDRQSLHKFPGDFNQITARGMWHVAHCRFLHRDFALSTVSKSGRLYPV